MLSLPKVFRSNLPLPGQQTGDTCPKNLTSQGDFVTPWWGSLQTGCEEEKCVVLGEANQVARGAPRTRPGWET